MSAIPYRVAIIDDEQPLIDMLAAMMPIDGRLEVAASYEAAVPALTGLAGLAVDAVICDVHMPGMDGLTALPELRKVCSTAVIAMYTADPDAAATAEALGADCVIDKAAGIDDLIDEIVILIGDKRAGAVSEFRP